MIREIEVGMWLQTLVGVVSREGTDIRDGLLKPSVSKCKCDGHHSAGEGGQHQEVCDVRHSGDATNCRHQFDVSSAHATGYIEQEKDHATDKAGTERAEELSPSTQCQMQYKAKQDRREGNEVRDSPALHVKDRPDQGAGSCGGGIHQI
jgi:hypothetical protein